MNQITHNRELSIPVNKSNLVPENRGQQCSDRKQILSIMYFLISVYSESFLGRLLNLFRRYGPVFLIWTSSS